MASPTLPSPVNYEDNRQPRAFPSVLITGGNGIATGIALQNFSGNLDVPGLSVNGTAFTSTPAELNVLAGVTPGTSAASKAAVLGANKNLDVLALPVGGLAIGAGAGTPLTPTAAEINVLAGATAGAVLASKAVVAGANGQLGGYTAPVTTLTATGAVTAAQAQGVIILNSAASIVITLPAANAGGAGVSLIYSFFLQVASTSGVGHIIRPVGSDVMRSSSITTPAAAKGIDNTQATSKIGDSVTVWSDGVSAWYANVEGGTWTREA